MRADESHCLSCAEKIAWRERRTIGSREQNAIFFGVCVVCLWFSSAIAERAKYLLHGLSCFKTFISVSVTKKRAAIIFIFHKRRLGLKFVKRNNVKRSEAEA